jgi:hypothetical protein
VLADDGADDIHCCAIAAAACLTRREGRHRSEQRDLGSCLKVVGGLRAGSGARYVGLLGTVLAAFMSRLRA